MAYRRRTTTDAVSDVFSLNPPPFPVLLILALISVLLCLHWYASYESVLEDTQEIFGWALLAVPVVLILAVRWISGVEDFSGWPFATSPYERRRRTHGVPAEGSSPWAVAAVIVVLLVLLQFQSSFHDSWFF
ncbi:hypothetical protein NMG60_11019476 [Bertholletia excelsa]